MVHKSPNKEPQGDTTALLLEAASHVFAIKGFSGATVKEIADTAGVNISLISYHFQGKEGLFRACLEQFGSARLTESEKILTPPESAEDMRAKLKLWLRQFLLAHVEDPDFCYMLKRENIFEMEMVKDVFENTFLRFFEAMVKFFQMAKKRDLIHKDLDPLMICTFFFGAIVHTADSDKVSKKYFSKTLQDEKYREQLIEQFITMLEKGISTS